MTIIAFVLIISGGFFWENRLIGYSLFVVGLIFAAVDIFQKSKK